MTSQYRIAYILTSIEFGGAQRVSLDFLRNANRNLFEIRPILFFRPWEEDSFFLKQVRKFGFCPYNIPVSSGKNDYLWLAKRFVKLFSFLKREHFHLLHTHGYVADILGISCACLLSIPIISTCHGFIENDKKLVLYNSLDRFFLRFSDELIAVSNDIREILVSAGVRPSKIKVIPNGVGGGTDEASSSVHRRDVRHRFAFSDKDFVIGYAGRLSQEKGLLHLIEAVSLARQGGCAARCLIIGEGGQEGELRAAAAREGLEDAVVFAGFQSDVGRFFPAMDVFVLPSLTEGTPMALLEAMAHGIPSVASAVGQIPHIIASGKTGILVRPGSANQLCEAIQYLYENPSMRKVIGEAGRKTIENRFDIQTWVERVESEYMGLLKMTRG